MSDTQGRPRLLVVEDDEQVLGLLHVVLPIEELEIEAVVDSAEAALALVVAHDYDAVVLDDRLNGPTRGVNLVPILRDLRPQLKIVLFSASADGDGHDVDAAVSKLDVMTLGGAVRRVTAPTPDPR